MRACPATQSHADILLPADIISLCDSLSAQNWRDTNIPWLDALSADDWKKVGRAAYGAARHDVQATKDHIATVLLGLERVRTTPKSPIAYVLSRFKYLRCVNRRTIRCVSIGGSDPDDPESVS
jgi:hypothetical protein